MSARSDATARERLNGQVASTIGRHTIEAWPSSNDRLGGVHRRPIQLAVYPSPSN
jgi:hypothetical protein